MPQITNKSIGKEGKLECILSTIHGKDVGPQVILLLIKHDKRYKKGEKIIKASNNCGLDNFLAYMKKNHNLDIKIATISKDKEREGE